METNRKNYNTTLKSDLIKKLKILSAETDKRQNDLLEEAIQALLKKYQMIESGLKESQSDEKELKSNTEEMLSKGIKGIDQSNKELNPKQSENLQTLKNKPEIRKWTPEELELINKKASMTLEPKKKT